MSGLVRWILSSPSTQPPLLSAEPPSATVLPPRITAVSPSPPNWAASLAGASVQLESPFIRTPIGENSGEYKEIAKLFGHEMIRLERVVNPELWHRFIRARAELLASKSSNLDLLSELGFLTGDEIAQKIHMALNYEQSDLLKSSPYSDNVVLLFHVSKGVGVGGGGASGVDQILSQGFDERLGTGGAFGRGIYFTDDPEKAIHSDRSGVLIVAAVLLGDCLLIDGHFSQGQGQGLLREPEKAGGQKRNARDLFFDSVVGRTTESTGWWSRGGDSNEYVVFNRAFCVPLYVITYSNTGTSLRELSQRGREGAEVFDPARRLVPFFAWAVPENVNINSTHAHGQRDSTQSPFYAATIFEAMKEQPSESCASVVLQGDAPSSCAGSPPPSAPELTPPRSSSKGTSNITLNGPPAQSPVTSSHTITNKEECLFCGVEHATRALQQSQEYSPRPGLGSLVVRTLGSVLYHEFFRPDPASLWEPLSCNHKISKEYANRFRTFGTTMSGVTHSFVKCLICPLGYSGTQIGDCPNGTMTAAYHPVPAAGYEHVGSISIRYQVPAAASDGRPALDRTACLPRTAEGEHVLGLLRTAWDRRLVFTVGTSKKTGATNVLVSNIEHKRSLTGGSASHGFPDPNYLGRVKQQLAGYGVQ